MNTGKQKKILGAWGESQVDTWMKLHKWNPIEKNLKIHGGEIDRVYAHSNAKDNIQLCIAEIKTNIIYSKTSFDEIFSEVGIKKYIKQNQIKNLYKIGENYLAKEKTNI